MFGSCMSDNIVGVGVFNFERPEMVALQNYTMRRCLASLQVIS